MSDNGENEDGQKEQSIHQSQVNNESQVNRSKEENDENQNENDNQNGEENKANEEEQQENITPFSYFEEINNDIIDDSNFESDKGKYKYCICVLMKDDTLESSILLGKTLNGIDKNLNSLKDKIDIESAQISIFIFVNRIYEEHLFREEDINKFEENMDNNNFDYLMRERTYKEDTELKNIKIYTIAKNYDYIFYDVSGLKLYYSFVKKLYQEKKIMFSSVITAGVEPVEDSLINLIEYSFHSDKSHSIAVAPIEYKSNDLISRICSYEKVHFNIYNMNYYFESGAIPISSSLSTMTIDNVFIKILDDYYGTYIKENATIDFHDYNLGLYIIRYINRKITLKYNYDKALGIIDLKDMSYLDYQKLFINKYSGYYGNFFEILRSFTNCNPCIFGEKIFLLFQLIAIATEFLLPSFSCMVIYTVFYEAFKTYDYRISLFFTSLYLCMMFASGVCSIITKEPKQMPMTNYFLYIFMEVLYVLVIICSVPAMHFAKTKNLEPDYKFNVYAISFIIIFTFIPYIIPFLLKVSIIGNNIPNMILYLLLGSS